MAMCLWRCSGREYLFRQSAHWYKLVLAAWPLDTALPFALAGAEVAIGEVAGVARELEVPEGAGDTLDGGAG